jgi:hypothetical protein
MKVHIMIEKPGAESAAADAGLLRRALRRFRLPVRETVKIEQTAARNRVERLFEVNFRTSCTR